MSKKLVTTCVAAVALTALVLPATGAASPVVTEGKGGPAVAVGTKIKATNVGNLTLWNTGHTETLITCTSGMATGTLTKNTGTEIEGNIESISISGTAAEGRCTSTFGSIGIDTNIGNGVPWCLRSGGEDKGTVRGGKCSEAARSMTVVLTSSTVGTCKYNRTAAVEGTVTTESTGDAILSLPPGVATSITKEEGGILCPASGELAGTLTVEKDTETAQPLYVS